MGTHTLRERDAAPRPSIKAERVSTYVYYLYYINVLLYVGFHEPVGPGVVDRHRNNNTSSIGGIGTMLCYTCPYDVVYASCV